MAATYRIPNGVLKLMVNGDVSLEPGKIDIGDNHQACTALELRFSMKLNVGAGYAGGALSAAKKTALFKGVRLGFSYGGTDEKARTEPYQDVTLEHMQRAQEVLLERLVAGFTDATTGLDKPLTAGTIATLTWKSLVPFDVEVLEPGVVLGAGRSQLLNSRLALSMGADPLAALDATLSISEIQIEVWADLRQVNGDQYSPIPHIRFKKEPGKLSAGFGDGLPIRLEDENMPQATRRIQQITVKVGDEVLVAPPATPDDVLNAYLEKPDVGTIEDTSEYRTLLYALPDTLMHKARTGHITVEQRTQDEDFKLVYLYLPVPTEEQVLRDVGAAARSSGRKAGDVILATSVPELDGYTVEGRHRPFVPFRVFNQGETQFDQYAGLLCVYGGEPAVAIPEGLLDRAARRYLEAMAEADGQGNEGVMRDTIRAIAAQVPGAVVSGRGFGGARSAIYAQVEGLILARVQALLEQAAAA